MRKFFSALMAILTMLIMTACGSDSASTSTTNEAEATPMPKTLVAYFSCTGNTKTLAQNAAALFKADLYEIKAKQPYTADDLDWHNESSRTTVEQQNDAARPEIDGKIENFDQYDKVIIAYPIWWHMAPRIIDTFVESYDWSGKTLYPICTSGGSDVGTSASYLATLAKGGDWKDGHSFFNRTSVEEIETWANGVGLK